MAPTHRHHSQYMDADYLEFYVDNPNNRRARAAVREEESQGSGVGVDLPLWQNAVCALGQTHCARWCFRSLSTRRAWSQRQDLVSRQRRAPGDGGCDDRDPPDEGKLRTDRT